MNATLDVAGPVLAGLGASRRGRRRSAVAQGAPRPVEGRDFGWKFEVLQDAPHDVGLIDERDAKASADRPPGSAGFAMTRQSVRLRGGQSD